jgi:uncharacterized protein YyaL (SSP411 family)
MPGFGDILARVADYFRDHEDDIRRQSAQLALAFERLMPAPLHGDVVLGTAPLDAARRTLEDSFDSRYGGFGRAPKFPHPAGIERCLRHWRATSGATGPDLKALYLATLTLTRMAEGGLYDQLGGGFSRYSVDDFWMIPHFEKMLYDNAQLLHTYACAALATGEALFARIAGETADWVIRDMRGALGGFYSSLDADSEGHEGKFYVWTRPEVQGLLTSGEYAVFAPRFGLDRDANFEGQWHLRVCEPASDESTSAMIDAARAKLLAARNHRVWPARDEKVLTSWNALTIKGLAVAGRVLQRPDLIDAASAAVDFIRHTLWREGRLLATYKDGRAHLPAYLDDYAFLADALLELLQSRWRSSDLDFARELLDVLLAKFQDVENGGFYFTASDHDRLIHRSKTFSDDSVPSGNGVAASVLCKLGYLLAETRYLDAAERTLKAAAALTLEYPQAHMSLLNALEDFLASMQIVIIRGTAADGERWARELSAVYAPTRMVFAIPDDAPGLPPALAAKPASGAVTAYVCRGMTCGAPLTDLRELARIL